MRDIITLQCNDCKERNYSMTKNKKKNTERLETKKFCRRCRHHTMHRETKLEPWGNPRAVRGR
jgi:large subunit ribosomal protein L33